KLGSRCTLSLSLAVVTDARLPWLRRPLLCAKIRPDGLSRISFLPILFVAGRHAPDRRRSATIRHAGVLSRLGRGARPKLLIHARPFKSISVIQRRCGGIAEIRGRGRANL